MKTCENCNIEIDGSFGSGRFCSAKCARSFSTKEKRKEINEKVKQKLIGRKLTEEHKDKLKGSNNGKWVDGRSLTKINYCRRDDRFCNSCGEPNINKKYKKICENCKTNYYKHYRPLCEFNFDVKDFVGKFDTDLLKEFGWYSPKNRGNNINGISKDHLYSVRDGFINKVDPELIKHPANCELVRHRDNQKKYSKSKITLEELLIRIKNW